MRPTDLRTSVRALWRAPGFLIAAVLTLALGLGANAILFNVVYALLWRSLPFPEPERLVSVVHWLPTGERLTTTSLGESALLRDRTDAFSEIGLIGTHNPLILRPDAESPLLNVWTVNGDYLSALRLEPLMGRFFTEEEQRDSAAVALITERVWRRQFGADPDIVDRIVPTESMGQRGELRIVGVVPGGATLPFASQAGVLLPAPAIPPFDGSRDGDFNFYSIQRLKPGVGLPAAAARIQTAAQAAERGWPPEARGWRRELMPLRDLLAPANRKVVLLLYGAAALLLILTCANVASLFLDRTLGRRREAAVRVALGASLWQLLETSLLESLLVCGAGGVLALGLERLARPLVLIYMPDLTALGPELLGTGPALLGFGLLSSLAVALTVALLPALQMRRPALGTALAQGGSHASQPSTPWRSLLVSAQVAVILVLLTVGSLVGHSFFRALSEDPGYDPRGVLTAEVWLPTEREGRTAADYALVEAIRSIPGTEAASFSVSHPLGVPMACSFRVKEGDFASTDPMISLKSVDGDYFKTLGERLVAGRTFTRDEVRRWAEVVILNESAARLLFGRRDPLGREVRMSFLGRRLNVVGIVNDARIVRLDQPAPPVAFLPFTPFGGTQTFLVRTRANREAFLSGLTARAKAMNAGIRLMNVDSLDAAVADTVRDRLRATVLVGGFGLLGLLIGSVGLYGLLSSRVRARQREIGIRIALGATNGGVVRRILRQGGILVGLGAAAGLAASAFAAHLIERTLYNVSPMDLPSFALALALLVLTALVACLIPARRAASVDPMAALRCE